MAGKRGGVLELVSIFSVGKTRSVFREREESSFPGFPSVRVHEAENSTSSCHKQRDE